MEREKESNSFEHLKAEGIIFEEVKKWLEEERKEKLELKENAGISVGSICIQPDFYSENAHIVGEIYAHIGKSKSGQDRKIAKDILKMLLIEKIKGEEYRKIIVVCDEEERKKLEGDSMIAESIKEFNIEVKMINIEPDLRDALIAEQEQQGVTKGRARGKAEIIINMHKKDIPLEMIAEIAEISIEDVKAIIERK